MRTKMADSSAPASASFPDAIMKWLGSVAEMMKALPVTEENSAAVAQMYTTLFKTVQAFIERLPMIIPAIARPSPSDLVRAAAATPLPQVSAEPAGPAAAPSGAEESEHEAEPEAKPAFKEKISLRQYGYKLSSKNATRFAALEKARAAHGSGTVAHRLTLLQEIWTGHAHTRAKEFVQNILADIAYLREMDRREAAAHTENC